MTLLALYEFDDKHIYKAYAIDNNGYHKNLDNINSNENNESNELFSIELIETCASDANPSHTDSNDFTSYGGQVQPSSILIHSSKLSDFSINENAYYMVVILDDDTLEIGDTVTDLPISNNHFICTNSSVFDISETGYRISESFNYITLDLFNFDSTQTVYFYLTHVIYGSNEDTYNAEVIDKKSITFINNK